MTQIKGTAIRGLLRGIKDRGWPIAPVVAALPPEGKVSFETQILNSSWYPYEAFLGLMQAIVSVHGAGEPAVIRRLARDGAGRDLSTTFKILLSVATMEFVVQRAQVAWNLHCDTGQCAATRYWPGGYVGEVARFPMHRLHCLYIEGWLEGLAEGLGGENVATMQTRCLQRGDASCEYTTTWSRLRRLFG